MAGSASSSAYSLELGKKGSMNEFKRYKRIIVAGVPQSGKTALAKSLGAELGYPVKHTDDLLQRDPKPEWSELSTVVAGWFAESGPWIVEGVAAVRGLRKYMKVRTRREDPCDLVLFMPSPHPASEDGKLKPWQRSQGHRAMATQMDKHFEEIHPTFIQRKITTLLAMYNDDGSAYWVGSRF